MQHLRRRLTTQQQQQQHPHAPQPDRLQKAVSNTPHDSTGYEGQTVIEGGRSGGIDARVFGRPLTHTHDTTMRRPYNCRVINLKIQAVPCSFHHTQLGAQQWCPNMPNTCSNAKPRFLCGEVSIVKSILLYIAGIR